ncbi:NADPH-dependent oxidoreductase, partial [Acinetobacter baumannii]
SSLSIIDPNAVIEIRDIFKRNKDEKFEANEFEVKGLQSILEKLQKYHLS